MERSELIGVLLSWASHLSGYTYPDSIPRIEQRPAAFFEQQVCAGRKRCEVVAWYDDQGVIYLDDRIDDIEDPLIRSVLVHELVHYLQDLSGEFTRNDCEEKMRRERQAYAIQRSYLNRIAGLFAATWPVYAPCPAEPGAGHGDDTVDS